MLWGCSDAARHHGGRLLRLLLPLLPRSHAVRLPYGAILVTDAQMQNMVVQIVTAVMASWIFVFGAVKVSDFFVKLVG